MEKGSAPPPEMGFTLPPSYDQAIETQPQASNHPPSNPNFPHQPVPTVSGAVYVPPTGGQVAMQVGPAPQSIVIQPYSVVTVGPHPCRIRCPHCAQMISTQVDYSPDTRTHMIALVLCLMGCCLCAFIPYLLGSCQRVNHKCPNCGGFIGSFHE